MNQSARKPATYADVLAAPSHGRPTECPVFHVGAGLAVRGALALHGSVRSDKLALYSRAGVSWAWLVNPINRTLEILRLSASRWELHATHRDSPRVRVEPFEAIELELGDLWLPEG